MLGRRVNKYKGIQVGNFKVFIGEGDFFQCDQGEGVITVKKERRFGGGEQID